MMYYGSGVGLWNWPFMGLFWIAIIGLVVWAVVALLPRVHTGGPACGGRGGSAEDILDRRFALGEIDVDQYRDARSELSAARKDAW